MMIINHVTEGMISDHVIGRSDYTYLGKVGSVASLLAKLF
jgi:hypothetical protein